MANAPIYKHYESCTAGPTVGPIVALGIDTKFLSYANNVLKDPDRHARELLHKGILYAPDYAINAGGLINVYNELDDYNRERA